MNGRTNQHWSVTIIFVSLYKAILGLKYFTLIFKLHFLTLFTITSFLRHFAETSCFHFHGVLLNADALRPYATLEDFHHTDWKAEKTILWLKYFTFSIFSFPFKIFIGNHLVYWLQQNCLSAHKFYWPIKGTNIPLHRNNT